MGKMEAIKTFAERVNNDLALLTELKKNPKAVFMRETGINEMDLDQMLSDAELALVTGGSSSDDYYAHCEDCNYKAIDKLGWDLHIWSNHILVL